MKNLFDLNGPLIQFLLSLRDLVVLNFLFLVCCIPIVTIGPALVALYTVTFSMVENKESYVARQFMKALKQNMKQGFLAELLLFLPILVLLFNIFFWNSFQSIAGTFIVILCTIILLHLLCVMMYTFPLLAKFNNTLKQTFYNALHLATMHKLYTLAFFALIIIFSFLLIFTVVTTTLTLLFGFAFLAYIFSTLLLKMLQTYLPSDETKEEL